MIKMMHASGKGSHATKKQK